MRLNGNKGCQQQPDAPATRAFSLSFHSFPLMLAPKAGQARQGRLQLF